MSSRGTIHNGGRRSVVAGGLGRTLQRPLRSGTWGYVVSATGAAPLTAWGNAQENNREYLALKARFNAAVAQFETDEDESLL